MKPILFALLALLFYAIQNVVLEQKLSKLNPFLILTLMYVVMLPMACLGWLITKNSIQTISWPSKSLALLTMAIGIVYLFADTFYVSAYNSGANIVTVTSIVILFPILATVIRYSWVGGWPNLYQFVGYLFAALSVLLIAKGNTA